MISATKVYRMYKSGALNIRTPFKINLITLKNYIKLIIIII